MQIRAISGPWAAKENILVCVGPSPLSERLVRVARRQADRMNARWTAIYVETPSHRGLKKEAKEQVWRSLQLAEKLGAKTVTVFGLNVADTTIDFARKHNITRIIIGKTLRPRWQEFVFGSVVDQLIHNSGTIDIHVISSSDSVPKKIVELETLLPATPPHGFINSFALIVVVTIIGLLVKSIISPANLMMLYVLAVVVAAYRWGMRPAIFTAVIGILAFDFVFIPPFFTFRVSDIEYFITFAGMIGVGALISLLVARVREHALAAQSRENETSTLYALSQELASAVDNGSIISVIGKHIDEIFTWQCAFFLPEGDHLVMHSASPELTLDADELAVATWAYKHGAIAGYDTDTLHGSRLRYIPLQTSQGVLGILGVKPAEPDGIITPEQTRILTAFASQAAIAVERVNLSCRMKNETMNR